MTTIDRDDPALAHLTPVEREQWIGEAVRVRFFRPDAPLPPIPSRQELDEKAARAADRARRALDEPDRHPASGLCSDPRCAHCHMSADVPGTADDLVPLPEPDPRVTAISERVYRAAWLLPLSLLIREGIQADRELSRAADVQSLVAMKRMDLANQGAARVGELADALRPQTRPRLGASVVMYLLDLCERAEQVLLRLDAGERGALDEAAWLYGHLRVEAGALAGEQHISGAAPSLTDGEARMSALAELSDVPTEPMITNNQEEN